MQLNLKTSGYLELRLLHNPGTAEVLDLCSVQLTQGAALLLHSEQESRQLTSMTRKIN